MSQPSLHFSIDPADRVISDTSECLDSWMNELGCAFVIVRPGHYVYATATSAADALRHLDSISAELQIG